MPKPQKSKYTWKEAIYEVMRKNGGQMATDEITQAILDLGLKEATPTTSATVGANIYTSIQKFGEKSPFRQVGSARFVLIPENVPQNKGADKDLSQIEVVESVNKTSIIKAFGMF